MHPSKITPDLKFVEKPQQAPFYAQIIKNRVASTSLLIQDAFEKWPPLGKMVSPKPLPYFYVQGKAWVLPDQTDNTSNLKLKNVIKLQKEQ